MCLCAWCLPWLLVFLFSVVSERFPLLRDRFTLFRFDCNRTATLPLCVVSRCLFAARFSSYAFARRRFPCAEYSQPEISRGCWFLLADERGRAQHGEVAFEF